MFPSLNNVNQTFIDVFCKVFDLYKECSSCLVSFLSFLDLFPTFDWAKGIGNLRKAFDLALVFFVLVLFDFPNSNKESY